MLSEVADADLFEIKPEVPYTSADPDRLDKNSKSLAEMKDKTARPTIAESNAKAEEYDVIYVGFSI